MVPLDVLLNDRIRFTSRPDLPPAFRRAIAQELTVPNYPPAVKKGGPATVEVYSHNPFNGEVTLPRSYWPRFLELAAEHGVAVTAADTRPDDRPVLQRAVAVKVQHLATGFGFLQEMLGGQLPADWENVHIHVTVTRYQHTRYADPDAEADEALGRKWRQDILDQAGLGEAGRK